MNPAASYRNPKAGRKARMRRALAGLAPVILVVFLAGCKGVSTREERAARGDLRALGETYRPNGVRPALPVLNTNSPIRDFILYALLNHPEVESAYYDWAGSVERITAERSLPDPQLTFQSDIADMVMTVMPGFMQMLPGPGKLKVRARVAARESEARYFTFESAVLKTAFNLKRAFYELHFLDERVRINRQSLALLNDLEQIARAQNEVGKATLQDVLRAQIERDRVNTEIENLEDSRRSLLATFKAALGIPYGQPDPPVPDHVETTETNLDSDELLRVGFERNPRLKAMEAEVRAAQAAIAVAYKERVPDFNLGLMADLKSSPTMFRPVAGMTLPIWRDKIAAEVAQATAKELAAKARLGAEQITLTVDFAGKSFAYRELSRNLALFRRQLVPKARQSLEIARGGYLGGTIDFFNLIDAEQTLLNFELSEIEARTQREIVLSELSLMIAGIQPGGAPVLAVAPDVSDHAQTQSNKYQP